MSRRKTLAALGAASGVYRTLVSFLVGVPQVRWMGDGEWGMGPGDGGCGERHRHLNILYTAFLLKARFLSIHLQGIQTYIHAYVHTNIHICT